MARGGVNKAMVQKARQSLLSRGENPSIDAVRVELGNTGSKSTIQRHLKELEGNGQLLSSYPASLSAELSNLVAQIAAQLEYEAEASVSLERTNLAEERAEVQQTLRAVESRNSQLEADQEKLADEAGALKLLLLEEREKRVKAEVECARLTQAHNDYAIRLTDRDEQIRSLEDKHQHARDALEHYRQASKEQREQDQRRHESQIQQLQQELRLLQQTLIIKQDDITQLNRDNARLLTEASLQFKAHSELQRLRNADTVLLNTTKEALSEKSHASRSLQALYETSQREIAELKDVASEYMQNIIRLNKEIATDRKNRNPI